MTTEDISKLIMRTALRDRAAFDELYYAVSAKLFGVCLRVLKDREDAEEAVQEVFVKVWTKADRFAVSQHSPMSWLIAIARNHAIDRLRARASEGAKPEAAHDPPDPAPGPEDTLMAKAQTAAVERCLDELEAARAAAVRSAYIDGDSYTELAERHDVPLNTMRTWLRRGLQKLRECLER
jgi:RNA polymerase sigma-70 factor (ECF subfamily)